MAICTGGTSPKSGSPAYFTYDEAYVAAKFGSLAGWLTTWAMGLPTSPQVTATFCATEPSTDLPTALDWAALALPVIALASGTYTRFGNQIKYDKWADLCRCGTAVLTGTCYSGLVTTGSVAPSTTTSPTILPTISHYTGENISITVDRLTGTDGATVTLRLVTRRAGVDGVRQTETLATNVGSASIPSASPYTINAADTLLYIDIIRGAGGTNTTYQARWSEGGTCPSGTVGAPTLVAPPVDFPLPPAPTTCASYQDVCTMLSSISNRLDWQRTQVDLLQRQAAPFGYLLGAPHTGLTGSGSIAVQGILGFRASLTTVPAYWGKSSDNPNRYIPAPGSVVPSTTDGDLEPTWLNEPTTFRMDPILGPVTALKYALRPGVTATITEIVREA